MIRLRHAGHALAGKVARLTREGIEAMQQDFITTRARASANGRSCSGTRCWCRGGRWRALADLLVGSFVVENLFQIPGIGVFLVNSSINRDYTVGLVILYSVLLLTLNLLVDVVGMLDKRVNYG